MSTSLSRGATDSGVFLPAEAPPRWARRAELAALQHALRAAMAGALIEVAGAVRIASAQDRNRHAAIALGGPLGGSTTHTLGVYLRALLDAGACHVVVDLSRAQLLDDSLAAFLRGAGARMANRGWVLELTGLSPRVLHGMDDDVLDRVFALYREAFESASPTELSWAALRCPMGLDEVAEPHTPARHRSLIDTRARVPWRTAQRAATFRE